MTAAADAPILLATLATNADTRSVIETAIGDAGRVVYLADVPAKDRANALGSASVVLAHNTAQELGPGEAALLANARLIQFVSAGLDYIPLADLPPTLPVAANAGAYAEPMAEHAVAMALAGMKRLFVEHAQMRAGAFNQFQRNRMVAGSVCGIVGFGGIGAATARLMRALGARAHVINRSGFTDEPVDWIGTPKALDHLLRDADIIVLSLPLTPATQGLIGARELSLMKPDAILVNVARGEIVDESALYDHLVAHPAFTACIDAWWIEPVRHGRFEMAHDFLSLPNVIGSPHNSASAVGWRDISVRRAAENARRALVGDAPLHLVQPGDRMM